jgi:hypothetical protein
VSLRPIPSDVLTLLGLLETGTPPPSSAFAVVEKAGADVLFTAPHAVCHYTATSPRRVKGSDIGTKELAFSAAAKYGCAALATQSPWQGNANADPVERCVFKTRVLHLLKNGLMQGVVDVHGMSDEHGLDVCVGSGGADTTLAHSVADVLTAAGFVVAVDKPFSASRSGTVTRTVTEAGFAAVQIEVSAAVRTSRQPRLLDALEMVVDLFPSRALSKARSGSKHRRI